MTDPAQPKKAMHIRLGDDLDRPIHRIFPLWLFEQAVGVKCMTFVKPSLWEDPFEDPCTRVIVQRKGVQKELAPHLRQVWAQCWSYEAQSDILLRVYSRVDLDPIAKRNRDPSREGVRVTSTTRKLLRQIQEWQEKHPHLQFLAGRVRYEPPDRYLNGLTDVLTERGESFFETIEGRAESLWRKRAMFQHEDEVRLLCIGPDPHGEGAPTIAFKFDPNQLFDEVAFDPRLVLFERREREAKARERGYSGPFLDRHEYVKPFFLCVIPDNRDGVAQVE